MTAFSKTARATAMYLSINVLFGCANLSDTPELRGDPVSIEFETTACFGTCPDFTLSVSKDGDGQFEGRGFVVARGKHDFAVDQEDFDNFSARLAPFRPEQSVRYDDLHSCDGDIWTDMPGVKITWRDADGSATVLDWYTGCEQPGLHERMDEIYNAWQELPITHLVGTEQQRRAMPFD